ncbi:MAG: hypothetical protein AAGM36_14025 [Cyanobacteria bacterium J06597_1]
MLDQQGRDRFRYNNVREGWDTIVGFDACEDRLEISLTGFRLGLMRGVLQSNQFSLGATTQTTHRFLFNNDRLFFDPDGSGARSAILLAKVTGNDLSRTNIVVV